MESMGCRKYERQTPQTIITDNVKFVVKYPAKLEQDKMYAILVREFVDGIQTNLRLLPEVFNQYDRATTTMQLVVWTEE